MDKTHEKHLNVLDQSRISKSEINALTKRLNYYSRKTVFRQSSETYTKYVELKSKLNSSEHQITKEQSDFGIEWLKNRYLKKNGQIRKALINESDDPKLVASIIADFSHFRFVGVFEHCNGMGQVMHHTPIYRTYDAKGRWFDYSPIYFGTTRFLDTFAEVKYTGFIEALSNL